MSVVHVCCNVESYVKSTCSKPRVVRGFDRRTSHRELCGTSHPANRGLSIPGAGRSSGQSRGIPRRPGSDFLVDPPSRCWLVGRGCRSRLAPPETCVAGRGRTRNRVPVFDRSAFGPASEASDSNLASIFCFSSIIYAKPTLKTLDARVYTPSGSSRRAGFPERVEFGHKNAPRKVKNAKRTNQPRAQSHSSPRNAHRQRNNDERQALFPH
jgi:hypothetical protein